MLDIKKKTDMAKAPVILVAVSSGSVTPLMQEPSSWTNIQERMENEPTQANP